jgi:hypothetical protein
MRYRYLISRAVAAQGIGGPSGQVNAGSNLTLIGGGQETVNLLASYTGEEAGVSYLWTQVSGETGSFSTPTQLATSFTTAPNVSENIVLKFTVTLNGESIFDELIIFINAQDIDRSNVQYASYFVNAGYYNSSYRGPQIYDENGNLLGDNATSISNTIYWTIPINSNYDGYIIERFCPNNPQWEIIERVPVENDLGFYVMPETTCRYRYRPVWLANANPITGFPGRPVVGTSDGPFGSVTINNTILATDAARSGSIVQFNSSLDTSSISRLAYTKNIITSDIDSVRTSSIVEFNSYLATSSIERIAYTKNIIRSGISFDTDSVRISSIVEFNSNLDSSNVYRLAYTLATLPV